jgi:uncharacterized Ntn-hydrolase superfamily protein
MTFTVVARCRDTGRTGVALATVSIAAGGLCPFYTHGGDIVVSQAYASRGLGHRLVRALEGGSAAQPAMKQAMATDRHIAYRQLMVLCCSGETLAYSGPSARPWCGHLIDGDVIVGGNVLAGPQVAQAMLDAYRAARSEALEERLLLALEAGRAAGGQMTPERMMLSERSAMLRVLGSGEQAGWPVLDLRVDLHHSAIHELRRLYQVHAVYDEYSQRRENDPPNAGSIISHEAAQVPRGGEFASRPSVYR